MKGLCVCGGYLWMLICSALQRNLQALIGLSWFQANKGVLITGKLISNAVELHVLYIPMSSVCNTA